MTEIPTFVKAAIIEMETKMAEWESQIKYWKEWADEGRAHDLYLQREGLKTALSILNRQCAKVLING